VAEDRRGVGEAGRGAVGEAVKEVVRTSYGRLVAFLASVSGDVAATEDAPLLVAIDGRRTEHHQPYWATLAEAHRTAGHANDAAKGEREGPRPDDRPRRPRRPASPSRRSHQHDRSSNDARPHALMRVSGRPKSRGT